MKIILAQPRGFCAGVDRAVTAVEEALENYGAPIYVRHEIVHNKYIVENLKKKGAVFVREVDEIPENAICIFSAHGVSNEVENNAKSRSLSVIDATCPLVTKVHKEAVRAENAGREIILIGHKGHPEVEGTSGRVNSAVNLISNIEDVENLKISDSENLSYITQTTLSVDDTKNILKALKKRFPNIKGPELKDICYATQNRQDAVKKLSKIVDLLLVVGAKNSSNSNRLRDLGQEMGVKSYLINDHTEIDINWLKKTKNIGISAGASAPEILVQHVIKFLKETSQSPVIVELMDGVEENVKFKPPIVRFIST